MKIYAIRNKHTKLFLENGKPMAKTRAIFSNKNTRLFTKKAAATNALECWSLGVWHNRTDAYGEQEGPEPPNTIPPDRNKAHLEVVEADVEFK